MLRQQEPLKRWPGYDSVIYYWHNGRAHELLYDLPRASNAGGPYIVWAKNKQTLKRGFAPWMRWLPAWLLWRLHIKLLYGKWRRDWKD